MKVLLTNDVKSLGKRGDVVEVKNGYGLNFLLPEGLAVLATPQAIKDKERLVASFKAEEASQEALIGEIFEKINGQTVAISVQAKDGKLFGSVSAKEVAEALQEFTKEVSADMVNLPKPLKTVGEHEVSVALGKKTAKVTVNVLAE